MQERGLSGIDVARILKRMAKKVGINPEKIAGHSLRAAFATQAAMNKTRFDKIKDQGGWKSQIIVKRYIRDANLFRDNAAWVLGL